MKSSHFSTTFTTCEQENIFIINVKALKVLDGEFLHVPTGGQQEEMEEDLTEERL